MNGRSFTLIELVIVVAIIGILAVVTMPRLADLIVKSQESSMKRNPCDCLFTPIHRFEGIHAKREAIAAWNRRPTKKSDQ